MRRFSPSRSRNRKCWCSAFIKCVFYVVFVVYASHSGKNGGRMNLADRALDMHVCRRVSVCARGEQYYPLVVRGGAT